MRWYIVFIIPLALSINDFALTAPVLVQEKRYACVDAVHVPKDVVTVLEKRVGDDLKLLGEYIDFFKPADEHAPSSSAPPGPGHGPKVDVPAPAPNPASPTVNPAPLTEPLSLSLGLSPAGSSMKGITDNLNTGKNPVKSPKPPSLPPPAPGKFLKSSYAHGSSSAEPVWLWPNHPSLTDMQAPAPNLAASTANPAPFMESSQRQPSTGTSMAWGNDHSGGQSNLLDFSKTSRKPVKSSGAHASSSSEPPWLWPNDVSMTDMHWQAPPNLAASKANPAPLMESSQRQPSTGTSMALGNDYSNGLSNLVESSKTSRKPKRKPVKSSGAHASSSTAPLSWPGYLQKLDVPPPTVNPASRIKSSGAHASSSAAPLKWPFYVPIRPKPATASRIAWPAVHLASMMDTPRVGAKPPRRTRKGPRPKDPALPTVPEQEVGTAPLPNPSSPTEHSD